MKELIIDQRLLILQGIHVLDRKQQGLVWIGSSRKKQETRQDENTRVHLLSFFNYWIFQCLIISFSLVLINKCGVPQSDTNLSDYRHTSDGSELNWTRSVLKEAHSDVTRLDLWLLAQKLMLAWLICLSVCLHFCQTESRPVKSVRWRFNYQLDWKWLISLWTNDFAFYFLLALVLQLEEQLTSEYCCPAVSCKVGDECALSGEASKQRPPPGPGVGRDQRSTIPTVSKNSPGGVDVLEVAALDSLIEHLLQTGKKVIFSLSRIF